MASGDSLFHYEMLKMDYSNNIGFSILTYLSSLSIFWVILHTYPCWAVFSVFSTQSSSFMRPSRPTTQWAGQDRISIPLYRWTWDSESDPTQGHMAIRNWKRTRDYLNPKLFPADQRMGIASINLCISNPHPFQFLVTELITWLERTGSAFTASI